MYDMHYDLLTILYFNMTPNNKYANCKKMIHDLKQIYQNNICGGIINLYFMTPEEMIEELDISLEEMRDIKNMFIKSLDYLKDMQSSGFIPYTTDFIYGIEGCDYIESEQELEQLYDLGLRSIILVWNHKNQYGSGYRTEEGLTERGKSFIRKALELGIIIDVSHANQKTFYDILDVYEKENKENSIIIATHSNVKKLCNRKRNLSDGELRRLKEAGGYIGLFTNGNFLSQNNEQLSYEERQKAFLKHLDYLIYKIGFDVDKIVLSTDDMNFHPNKTYHHLEAFPIKSIRNDMFTLLSQHYGVKIANQLMVENAKQIIQKNKKKW